MHMADALLSSAVGGGMWAVTAGLIAYSAHKVKKEFDDRKVPLMGVLGAFIFAAQMINFTIPATGSSGHLGGGLLLAVLLGPYGAFLTVASVLIVQALFFADGGLLALGCNIFNMGFLPCFVAYPLVYRPLAGAGLSRGRLTTAAIIGALVALQFGAFAVVSQTFFSGISVLPFRPFLYMMLPIHLAIGLVEGAATAGIVYFVSQARPEILAGWRTDGARARLSMRKFVVVMLVFAAATGAVLSHFASEHPDGLEWSIARVTGQEEIDGPYNNLHVLLKLVQNNFSFLPDYTFRAGAGPEGGEKGTIAGLDPGTATAGLVGGILTLGLALAAGGLAVWQRGDRAKCR